MSVSADGIISRQIKILGYKGDAPIDNIANLNTAQMIDILRFLFGKFPDMDPIPPPTKNSALLYKYASGLIEIILKLGYSESLGYDAILYPQPDKTRSIFSFILEKVPRADAEITKSVTVQSASSLAIKAAQEDFAAAKKDARTRTYNVQPVKPITKETKSDDLEKIAKWSTEPRIPFYARPIIFGNGIVFNKQLGTNSLASLLASNDRESAIDQFDVNIEHGTRAKLNKYVSRAFAAAAAAPVEVVAVSKPAALPSTKARSRIANTARFEFGSTDTKIGTSAASAASATVAASAPKDKSKKSKKTEETKNDEEAKPQLTVGQAEKIRAAQREETQAIVDRIEATEAQAADLERDIEATRASMASLKEQLDVLLAENKSLAEKSEKAKKMATIAQSDKSEIRSLQRDLTDSMSTLLELARQWERRRSALVDEYRSLSAALRKRAETYAMQTTMLNKLKKKVEDGEEKLKKDEEAIQTLRAALEDRGEQKPRSEYIENIFMIIRTIEKQEAEVESIRADIRQQHAAMNQVIDKVKRTWALLDETVYSAAKKSNAPWAKKTYKIVVELLTLYEGISEAIEQKGRINAQQMELNSKIARVETQVDVKALEKIEEDLAEVKREIAQRS